jgi:hypothetical protein
VPGRYSTLYTGDAVSDDDLPHPATNAMVNNRRKPITFIFRELIFFSPYSHNGMPGLDPINFN